MPLGISVSDAEIAVVRENFEGDEAKLKVVRGIIEFSPKDAREIVNTLVEIEDDAAKRLIDRVIALTGTAYFDLPVASEPEINVAEFENPVDETDILSDMLIQEESEEDEVNSDND